MPCRQHRARLIPATKRTVAYFTASLLNSGLGNSYHQCLPLGRGCMHDIASRAYEPLATTIPSCMWSNKELNSPVTDHRPCGSQLHHAFSGTSLQSYAVTTSLDYKIAAAFSFHRFPNVGQFTTPTDSTFNPTILMAHCDISWHLTQHLTQPEAQKLTRLAEAQSCSYPGLLIHPALQHNVMILISLLPVLPGHPSSN